MSQYEPLQWAVAQSSPTSESRFGEVCSDVTGRQSGGKINYWKKLEVLTATALSFGSSALEVPSHAQCNTICHYNVADPYWDELKWSEKETTSDSPDNRETHWTTVNGVPSGRKIKTVLHQPATTCSEFILEQNVLPSKPCLQLVSWDFPYKNHPLWDLLTLQLLSTWLVLGTSLQLLYAANLADCAILSSSFQCWTWIALICCVNSAYVPPNVCGDVLSPPLQGQAANARACPTSSARPRCGDTFERASLQWAGRSTSNSSESNQTSRSHSQSFPSISLRTRSKDSKSLGKERKSGPLDSWLRGMKWWRRSWQFPVSAQSVTNLTSLRTKQVYGHHIGRCDHFTFS